MLNINIKQINLVKLDYVSFTIDIFMKTKIMKTMDAY